MKVHPYWLRIGILSWLGLLITGCGPRPEVLRLDFREVEAPLPAPPPSPPPLYLGVSAILSFQNTLLCYHGLVDYLEEHLGRTIAFKQRATYQEVNDLLRTGQLDVAFVCSLAYVLGHDEFGLELLAAPQVQGHSVYRSYLIVPAASRAHSLDHLRKKTFAFTDPLSNTGCLVPTWWLQQRGETPRQFFRDYLYTHAHDKSIEAVANQLVDGAAVDSLVYDYLRQTHPEITDRIRIIAASPPFGIPPVVVRPGLPMELKAQLRQLLLQMHRSPAGREALRPIGVDRFVDLDDGAYQSIREMWQAVHGRDGETRKLGD